MTKKVILVVEDQPELRKLIVMTLDYDEFEVHSADNGESGLKMIKALRPSLVLLDVMMPGRIDGYQVCKCVRADPEISRTPVVLLTARCQESDIAAGSRAGCDFYLTKPFSPLQLIETVERLILKDS